MYNLTQKLLQAYNNNDNLTLFYLLNCPVWKRNRFTPNKLFNLLPKSIQTQIENNWYFQKDCCNY